MSTYILCHSGTELYHHGILGQKWGIRRFQNKDGSLTPEGIKRYGSKERKDILDKMDLIDKINYKKHIKKDGTLDDNMYQDIFKAYKSDSNKWNLMDWESEAIATAFANTIAKKYNTKTKVVEYVNMNGRPYIGYEVWSNKNIKSEAEIERENLRKSISRKKLNEIRNDADWILGGETMGREELIDDMIRDELEMKRQRDNKYSSKH